MQQHPQNNHASTQSMHGIFILQILIEDDLGGA